MCVQLAWEKLETVVFLILLGCATFATVYAIDRMSEALQSYLNSLILDSTADFYYLDVAACVLLLSLLLCPPRAPSSSSFSSSSPLRRPYGFSPLPSSSRDSLGSVSPQAAAISSSRACFVCQRRWICWWLIATCVAGRTAFGGTQHGGCVAGGVV